MAITINGASDDLIEIKGDVNDEFYLPQSDKAQVILTDHYDEGRYLVVTLDFCQSNAEGWSVSVRASDGDPPLWPLFFHPREYYSETPDAAVTIDCPPGTMVTWDEEDE